MFEKIGGKYMNCERCPLNAEEIERRKGIDEDDYQPEYCYCEKVGGKHYIFGYCGEADEFNRPEREDNTNSINTNIINIRHNDKRNRMLQRKEKERKLRVIINQCGYAPNRGYVDWGYVGGIWQEVGDHIKYPARSNKQKQIKRATSHKIRKTKDVTSGNGYRRHYDYFHSLY